MKVDGWVDIMVQEHAVELQLLPRLIACLLTCLPCYVMFGRFCCGFFVYGGVGVGVGTCTTSSSTCMSVFLSLSLSHSTKLILPSLTLRLVCGWD